MEDNQVWPGMIGSLLGNHLVMFSCSTLLFAANNPRDAFFQDAATTRILNQQPPPLPLHPLFSTHEQLTEAMAAAWVSMFRKTIQMAGTYHYSSILGTGCLRNTICLLYKTVQLDPLTNGIQTANGATQDLQLDLGAQI